MGQVAQIEQVVSVIGSLATHYGMDKAAFIATIKQTVMPANSNVSNEQLAAFCLVAKEYKLNPFTKEIFAFPNRGGIQPVVSVDGWMKLINSHPDFDGMDFVDVFDGDKLVSVTCKMYRKNHSHPVTVTEYMAECRRDTDVWKKWPARMLRHKAAIQAARYAFGFAGIVEPDEAERMAEVTVINEPSREDQRKQLCSDAAEKHAEAVRAIKTAIYKEDWTAMTDAWSTLSQDDQIAINLAPSKGGIFSTHERGCIKYKQVRVPALPQLPETSDNPEFPLED